MKKFSLFLIISVILGYLIINMSFLISFKENIIWIINYKNYKYDVSYNNFLGALMPQKDDKYRTEIKYNIANNLYKQKKYNDAIEKYREIKTDDEELNYKINHNTWNSYYRLWETKDNRDEKIWLYQWALKKYQDALQIKENAETKANYEFVKKELEKLLQEKKKQEEEQKRKEQEQSQKWQKEKEENNWKQDKKDEELKPKDNSAQTKKDSQEWEKKDESKTQSWGQDNKQTPPQNPQRWWTNSWNFQNSGIESDKDKLSEEDIKSLEQRINELKQLEKENLKNINKSGENWNDFFKNFNFWNIFDNFFEWQNFWWIWDNWKDW